ncbi:biotin synthase BioB [Candidatus Vallotia lariciata]|uniref:biotin synthase BioB n=1 Tax=Candidatus Vallotia laricis TaxID=2018052 RepID=UPI001D03315F|nr:biotin synthase BioB [Candidatus Vallotia lariciata]UDG83041.1 Biotin synthase [Candidatus Vallotia lariciata]
MSIRTIELSAHSSSLSGDDAAPVRHDWTREQIAILFNLPFDDLLYRAHTVQRCYHAGRGLQISQLLAIKTGGCPEDCGYCSQSVHADTDLKANALMSIDAVLEAAAHAKSTGVQRFCMGAAWRSPRERDLERVCSMVEGVKAIGLETCVTLGMLTATQAQRLADVGLDYYNHNIDTSPEYYSSLITTRTLQDRLDTLEHVRNAGLKVCCGGIVGMGESRDDRVGMLQTLANLPEHPESVPVNSLIRVEGARVAHESDLDVLEFVRTISVARIIMPMSVIRLSAGREHMSDELQALCMFAGAGSVFIGEKLLTAPNPTPDQDRELINRLGATGRESSPIQWVSKSQEYASRTLT